MELTEKEQLAREMVCLPLDGMDNIEAVEDRVEELSPVVGLFKIGKETFTRFGPEAIEAVHQFDAEVFLDLKYHDIPNTVRGAADAACSHGVYMFNVHASGGSDMLKAAVDGAAEGAERYGVDKPKVIGVTVLTSIDEATYLNTFKPAVPGFDGIDLARYINMSADDEVLHDEFRKLLETHNLTGIVQKQVLHLARLSETAGLDGIVCSAADLYAVKDNMPDNFMNVTPAIKGPNTPAGADQKRVFTPGHAVQDGSSILVIGRAITGGKTPEERLQNGYDVLKDMAKYI